MQTPLHTPGHGLLAFLAYMAGLRFHKGTKWCRTRGIGSARKVLNTDAPNLADLGMITVDSDPNALRTHMYETRLYLAFNCRLCGQCDLSEAPP